MRAVSATLTTLVLAACFIGGAQNETEGALVRLRLDDAESGKGIGGIVRVFVADKKEPVALPGLYNRLRGLGKQEAGRWYVVPADGAMVRLPRARLRLEAVRGLASALASAEVDLTREREDTITLKLAALFRPEKQGLVAGNTHLHLKSLSAEEAEEYLRKLPAADGLRVMFISYLERHQDDLTYVTNRYPPGDLAALSATGVLFNNGEEHRHNFGAQGEGYGHVMFLGLRELVRPVSLGPGITGSGNDDRDLTPGIEDARRQGATVVWCHNTFGHEDVVNALAGRLDALNVFDGSRRGLFEENYYRYLGLGLRMPISTGTDWFLYDFARVYARVDGPVSVPGWLAALKAGRCQATNGPLLNLTVDGKEIGDVIRLDAPRKVTVEATAVGRHDFRQLQLIQNGVVVQRQASVRTEGGWTARLSREVRVDEPGWFAARIESTEKNELDQVLFAHSSPIYVDVTARRFFDPDAARGLLKQIEEAQADIRARGNFSSDRARTEVLARYEAAARDLQVRINTRGKTP